MSSGRRPMELRPDDAGGGPAEPKEDVHDLSLATRQPAVPRCLPAHESSPLVRSPSSVSECYVYSIQATKLTAILGLGVGMTTTVFAIVDSLLLNAVPFAESHRQLVPLLGIAPELGRASAPDERGRRRSLPKLASPRPCRRRGWSDTQWRGQLKVRGSARKPFPPARSTTAVNPLRASSAPDEAIAGRRGRRAPGAGQ